MERVARRRPPRHDDLFQIDAFPDGEGAYGIGGRTYIIDPHTFFFVPPGCSHEILGSTESLLVNITVKFRHPAIGGDFLPPAFRPDAETAGTATGLFRQVISEAVLEDRTRGLVAALRLTELLALLVQTHRESGAPRGAHPAVAAAMRFMAENLGEAVSLADVARAAGVAKEYLCRIFRKETGTTPFGLLRLWRVEYARGRLARTAKPISEIAAEAGFGTAKDMNRVFNRLIGVGPRECRKMLRRERAEAGLSAAPGTEKGRDED